jgi:hypothetical protein
MILPPLDVVESWPLPNYVDPITRGPANLVVNLVLFPLVCVLVALRLYTRLHISRSSGPDDWLILASLVRSLPSTSIITLTVAVSHRRIGSPNLSYRIPLWLEQTYMGR